MRATSYCRLSPNPLICQWKFYCSSSITTDFFSFHNFKFLRRSCNMSDDVELLLNFYHLVVKFSWYRFRPLCHSPRRVFEMKIPVTCNLEGHRQALHELSPAPTGQCIS